MSLKNSFENELKHKLLMKTVCNQSEEMVLLRAFKYFDLSNTNFSDKNTFVKAVMKIGITGFTEEDIASFFDFYDTNNTGIINYKDFIGLLYSNPSIMDNPELLKQQHVKNRDYPYAPTPSVSQHEQQQKKDKLNPQYQKENTPRNQEQNLNRNLDEKNISINTIIDTIRNNIKMKGIRCLITLENNFRSLDDDNSQTINFNAFEKISNDFNFDISFDELQKIFKSFDKKGNGRIDYDEFIRIIRGQMNNSRRNLIEQIFNTFEPDREGNVHIKKINQLFNPENHPDALTGKRNPEDLYREFVDTFEGNHNYLNGDEAEYGNVDIDEFCDYYDSLSMMIENDEEFENIVRGVWLNEVDKKSKPLRAKKVLRTTDDQENIKYDNENKDEGNDNDDEYYDKKEDEKQKEVNEGFESFKKYLQQKDAKTVLTLARQFKILDENDNKTIDFGEFCRGITKAGLDIPDDVLQELFNDFDYDGSGMISYDEFIVKILGNLNARREEVVRAAFNKLDIDKSGVIELNEIKSFYSTKNNPQVLNGEINEEQLYTHFVETFGNHHNYYSGIRDKRVTWKEFLNYYRFMSFYIPDDDLFEAILVAAWKLDNIGEYNKSQRDEDLRTQKQLEKAIGEKQQSLRGRKNDSSIKGGGAPFGVDRDLNDYLSNNNNDNNKLRSQRNKKNYDENEQKDNKDNLNENKNDNYNNNNEYNYSNRYKNRKPQQYPESQTQYQKSNSLTTGEMALNTLKDAMKKRGSRGIMGMRRFFMIYDEDNSGKLTFQNFYKYITRFLIPLTKGNAAALFKLYDRQVSGVINYDSLIKELVGKLSESRKNLVNSAFNKLDESKKGVLNINVIKEGFNPKGHPDVINGKKTEQEVLSEFLDNIDYHFNLLNQEKNPDDEEITNQDFIDFYRYISLGIEDDYFFNKMMTGVWRLNNPNNNNTRRYY